MNAPGATSVVAHRPPAQDALAPAPEHAAAVHACIIQVLAHAAEDVAVGERLALAQATVHVHLRDSPQELAVTLRLNQTPIQVLDGAVGSAEIEVWIDTVDACRFWTGDLHLAMAIARGDVVYRGPVRKLLRVVPIARRFVDEFGRLLDARGLGFGTSSSTTTAPQRSIA